MYTNTTYFFRNMPTMNFVTDYITKNYPQGTHIAEFASSTGEEAYTLAMLLKKDNLSKKYTITGYDIVPKLINTMDSHLYEVTNYDAESFLASNSNECSNSEKNLKRLFDDHFEKIPKEWQTFEYTPYSVSKIKNKMSKSTDANETSKLKYMLTLSQISEGERYNYYYIPKKNAFEGVVKFKNSDIRELGDTFKLPKNTNVIFFKNAIYHILEDTKAEDNWATNIQGADKVVKEINRTLPRDGLFVVGALARDHLYKTQQPNRSLIQDGKEIKVFDNSKFHSMMKSNGFEPVFYELMEDCPSRELYLPSVWKKVRYI